MTVKEQLQSQIDRCIAAAQQDGIALADALEVVSDAYFALVGDRYLADHYGGDVPPRLEVRATPL